MPKPRLKITRQDVFAFCLTAVLSVLILIFVLQLWHADLNVPLRYGFSSSDLTFEVALVKSIAENGWYLRNPYLGAPGSGQLFDFPMSDSFHFLIIKVLTLFLPFGAALNVFYLLGYLLAALTALAVFRHFRISYPPAIVGSLLFAFAPYHLYRNEEHLLLSSYYLIPLMSMVLLWVLWREPLLDPHSGSSFWSWPRLTCKGWAAVFICALTGSGGVYYAFFGAGLLAMAGLYSIAREWSPARVKSAALLVCVLGASVIANISPSMVYFLQHGRNAAVAARSPVESEIYGLKVIQLLLPVDGHRIPWLGKIHTIYAAHANMFSPGEGDFGTLGIIGAAGFCCLMACLLTGVPAIKHRLLLKGVSVLALCAVLIGTIGGIGTIIAYLLLPEIRCYNRISIYIAFLSMSAVVVILDELWQLRTKTRTANIVLCCTLPLVLVAGIFDQTAPNNVPAHESVRRMFQGETDFIGRVEAALPEGAMVFELPYLSFPEGGPLERMLAYDNLRPYLHSHRLRWSFGAARGRYTDAWIRNVVSQRPESLAEAVAIAGFDAIYIDRYGYADSGADLEAHLAAVASVKPLVSQDRRMAVYDLRPLRRKLRSGYSPERWEQIRDAVLHPIGIAWRETCAALEGTPEKNWRWCGPSAELRIENNSGRTREITVEMSLASAAPETSQLRIAGSGFSQTLAVNGVMAQKFSKTLAVHPGIQAIRFASNARSVSAPGDARILVFRIGDFRVREAPDPVQITWGTGCSGIENSPGKAWRWCSSEASLLIRNSASNPVEVPLTMRLSTGYPSDSVMQIQAPGISDSLKLNNLGVIFTRNITAPPGESTLRLRSSEKPFKAPGDPRVLVFRVEDFGYGNPLFSSHAIPMN